MGNAVRILRQIASVRVKILSKIKLVSSKQNKGEKAPLLVDMGGSKTPLLFKFPIIRVPTSRQHYLQKLGMKLKKRKEFTRWSIPNTDPYLPTYLCTYVPPYSFIYILTSSCKYFLPYLPTCLHACLPSRLPTHPLYYHFSVPINGYH